MGEMSDATRGVDRDSRIAPKAAGRRQIGEPLPSEGKGHRSHLRIVSGAPIHATRCTRPRQTVTPPHLAATQRVDRSTVRGVELSGALLEADAVVIAMGALVADGRAWLDLPAVLASARQQEMQR